MNKKQKSIVTVIAIGLILIGGIIGIASSRKSANTDVVAEDVVEEKHEIELSLDYKEELEDEYKVNMDGEELIIITSEITPEIDTSEIGTSKHTIEMDEKVFDLIIEIVDKRELTLNDLSELTVETESTQEDLEAKLVEELTPELDEGEELQFKFSYSDDFNLDVEGEYELEATANFENNRKNTAKQTVLVKVVTPVEEEPEEEVVADNSGSTGQTESTGGSSNSGSTGGSSNNSGSSGSSGSSSSGSSGSSSKPAPAPQPTPAPKPGNSGVGFGKSAEDKTPAPQPEPKPEPAPAPKVDQAIKAPSGVPSGAKLIESYVHDNRNNYDYSYSVNLPGGGKINNVGITDGVSEVFVSGIDTTGVMFGITVRRHQLEHAFRMSELTDEGLETVKNVGLQFLSAHGM